MLDNFKDGMEGAKKKTKKPQNAADSDRMKNSEEEEKKGSEASES